MIEIPSSTLRACNPTTPRWHIQRWNLWCFLIVCVWGKVCMSSFFWWVLLVGCRDDKEKQLFWLKPSKLSVSVMVFSGKKLCFKYFTTGKAVKWASCVCLSHLYFWTLCAKCWKRVRRVNKLTFVIQTKVQLKLLSTHLINQQQSCSSIEMKPQGSFAKPYI